jgi:PAS domain S-box-containing protein
VVQATPDGLWVLDPDGRTVFANDRMAELLGREPDEMPGFDAFSALDELGQQQLRAHLDELEADGEPGDNLECSLLRRDGGRLEALISHTPIIDDLGRRRGWLHRVSEYTAQRHLLETLQRREQQLADAQAIARLGSWEWDLTDDVVTWSDELYRIYELEPREGVPTYAVLLDAMHPDDRELVRSAVARALATGEPFEFDARVIRRDDLVGWIRGQGIVVRDDSGAPVRMRGTTQDITAAKDAEQALELLSAVATAANDADTLADAVPVAVGIVMRYTAWRAQAAYLVAGDGTLRDLSLGGSGPAPGTVGADIPALAARSAAAGEIVTQDQPDALLLAAPLLAGDAVAGVIVLRRQGTALPESWETTTVMQAMALFARVTEREQASEALAAARDEAMSASRAKSDFLATMSHEIRTPLNGVIGLSELLSRTELSERQRQLADGIEEAGRALLALVNDVLDLSKIEAGRLDLEEVDFDPRAVIENSASLVAGAARAKSLEYVIAADPDLPGLVRGDPVRLGQVVANLTSNAVKFTSRGEVVLRAWLDAERDERSGGPRLRVDVSDTGVGIAAGEQDRLFDAFAQADSSTTRQFGGTGLGLAISRRIVSAMRGEIGVVSAPGEGSTFWFTAALGLPEEDTPRRTAALEAAVRGARVLVVDDNHTNRLILLEHLTAWGADVTAARSAAEGLELLRAGTSTGRAFDVVVLDYLMPGVDGLELARQVRRGGEEARILLLTSAVEPAPEVLAEAGIDLALSKPILSTRLLEAVAGLLGVAGRRRPEARPAPAGDVPVAGRVLLVEDNPVNQLVAEGILDSLGYAVVLAENGREAVALFAEDPDGVDAVLMDCQMPVMDGFDATRSIRAMEEPERRVPIIALTAAAVAGERERCLDAGMDDFLTKPVDVTALRAALLRWVAATPEDRGDDEPGRAGGVEGIGGVGGVDRQVLDPDRLEELVDLDPGDPSLLLRFIGRFGANARAVLADLYLARESGAAHDVGRLAHGLKGSAANLGAHRLATVCKQLEDLGDEGVLAPQGDLDRVAREVEAASTELERFAAGLGG